MAKAGRQIQRRVAEWSKLGDPEARVSAALRFVQDEVRYLGLEVGPHSLEPHDAEPCSYAASATARTSLAPGHAAARARHRRGSCARAFVAPAPGDGSEPSPYAFDHVIVRARLGGQEHWLDPTASFQRGAPDALFTSALRARARGARRHASARVDPGAGLPRSCDRRARHIAVWAPMPSASRRAC